MDFKDYLRIIRRRWIVVVLIFVIVGVAHFMYVKNQVPVYEAGAELLAWNGRGGLVLDGESAALVRSYRELSWFNRSTDVLSREVLKLAADYILSGKAVQRLDSRRKVVQEFNFSELLQTPFFRTEILAKSKRDFNRLNEQYRRENTEQEITLRCLQRYLARNVLLPDKESGDTGKDIIRLTVTGLDPQVARILVNAVALAAEQYYLGHAQRLIRETVSEINRGLTELKENEKAVVKERLEFFEEVQKKSDKFKPGFNFSAKENALLGRVSALERHIEKLKTDRMRKVNLYNWKWSIRAFEDLENRLERGDIFEFPELVNIRTEIRKQTEALADLQNNPPYRKKGNPVVKAKQKKIKFLQKEYEETRQIIKDRELNKALEKEKSIQKEIKLVDEEIRMNEGFLKVKNGELEIMGGLSLRLAGIKEKKDALGREIERDESLLRELEIRQNLVRGAFKLDEWAKPETIRILPTKGTKMQDILIAFLLALVVAIFSAYSIEYLDTRIRSEYDIRKYLNLPVIGFVPHARPKDLLLTTASPFSKVGESFNYFSSVLKAKTLNKRLNTIMLCSSNPGEGKTTVSINLAVSLARKRHDVILVDADMRHPNIHKYFALDNTLGFSSLFEGETPINITNLLTEGAKRDSLHVVEQYIQPTTIERLRIITAGPIPADPINILENKLIRLLVKYLKSSAEYVIIDTPPLNLVGDALSLAPLVDRIIMVVGVNMVDRRDLTLTKRTLQSIRPNLMGVILNRTRERRYKEYYYYYTKSRKGVHER